MYLADYHVHSRISPDAGTSMADMARAAVAAGVQELCFTDHAEPAVVCGRTFDWGALQTEFEAAQAEMGDRICLRLGVELGDACRDFAQTEQMMGEAPPLDFIIGSVHWLSPALGGENLYLFNPENDEAAYAGIADYVAQVRNIAAWGKFSVLGHLTVPLRYLNECRGFRLSFDPYEEEVREIFRLLIQNGCGIELNTNLGNTPLPDAKWLRVYRELGGEIITLGSDAHRPEVVGRSIRERQALLKECGFQRFCTFEKLRPVWHEL